MRLYWWNGRPNLGDQLTRFLLEAYGHGVEWAGPSMADWVGIGSVLESFHDSTATIWGTGRAGPHSPSTNLGRANVLALRGMESAALATGANVQVFGDPGLLVPDLVRKPDRDYTVETTTVIVPHFQDQQRMLTTYPGCVFVDVTGGPMQALGLIAAADRVVSSSLHGLVIADAYGIPRMWDWFDGVQGRGFKFRDYFSIMGKAEPGVWATVPSSLVHAVRSELKDCLTASLSAV